MLLSSTNTRHCILTLGAMLCILCYQQLSNMSIDLSEVINVIVDFTVINHCITESQYFKAT